ncbi:MAG TPA: hypothetical protein VF996_03080 [Candidatus Saccharimonadales bacterium]
MSESITSSETIERKPLEEVDGIIAAIEKLESLDATITLHHSIELPPGKALKVVARRDLPIWVHVRAALFDREHVPEYQLNDLQQGDAFFANLIVFNNGGNIELVADYHSSHAEYYLPLTTGLYRDWFDKEIIDKRDLEA